MDQENDDLIIHSLKRNWNLVVSNTPPSAGSNLDWTGGLIFKAISSQERDDTLTNALEWEYSKLVLRESPLQLLQIQARKWVAAKSSLRSSTALMELESRPRNQRFSTGSSQLDAFLFDQNRDHNVIMVFGAPSSGKTQLALSITSHLVLTNMEFPVWIQERTKITWLSSAAESPITLQRRLGNMMKARDPLVFANHEHAWLSSLDGPSAVPLRSSNLEIIQLTSMLHLIESLEFIYMNVMSAEQSHAMMDNRQQLPFEHFIVVDSLGPLLLDEFHGTPRFVYRRIMTMLKSKIVRLKSCSKTRFTLIILKPVLSRADPMNLFRRSPGSFSEYFSGIESCSLLLSKTLSMGESAAHNSQSDLVSVLAHKNSIPNQGCKVVLGEMGICDLIGE